MEQAKVNLNRLDSWPDFTGSLALEKASYTV